MRTRRALAIAAATAVALAAPAVAAAHGSAAYVATVRGVTPSLRGVVVEKRRDGGIVLTNATRETLIVFAPTGAPYLRFRAGGIDANIGRPGAAPEWAYVTRGRTFAWEDSRTTYDSEVPPLAVRKEPGKPHHIRDWRIPLRVGGRAYAVVGSLDYTANEGGLAELLVPFAPMPLLLLLGVGIARRVRG